MIVLLMFSPFAFAGPKLPDACTLLTAADVEQVIGSGFQLSPFHGTASDNSNCGYIKDKQNVVNLLIVDGGQDMSKALKEMQKVYTQQNHKVVPIDGVGEGAFYVESTNSITKEPLIAVHFGKGEWHFVLEVKLNGKPDAESEQKLAKIIYGRLA
jgi:hypothetical protein